MGPDERRAPLDLFAKPSLERAREPILRPVVSERAPILERYLAVTRKYGIETFHFQRQRRHRRSAAPEHLATDPDELFVPWLDARAQLRSVQTVLQETITPAEDLSVPTPRRQVDW